MKRSLLFFLVFMIGASFVLNAQTVRVTFRVNMAVKMKQSKFDPTKDALTVAGNFQGWNATANPLTRVSPTDSIWTANWDSSKVGDTLLFKFIINGATWEDDPNRQIIVPAGGTTYNAYFNRDSVFKPIGNGNIVFTVNMSVLTECGIFNPATDSVSVRGGFNGWGDNTKNLSFMAKDQFDPNTWFINEPFTNTELNSVQQYKYYVRLNHPDTLWTGDNRYERPATTGGGNRTIAFLGSPAQNAGDSVYFDGVKPAWVIPAGTSDSITFQVNMAPAMNPKLQAILFNPSTDKVYWICAEPAFQRTQNWVINDTFKVLQLKPRAAGDSIYVGTLKVKGPSFNSFVYRYGFQGGADGKTWTYEPNGFSNFAYRVRFIGMTAPRTFKQPYTAPVDTWTNAEIKKDVETSPAGLPTGVEQLKVIAKTYKLEQNYPNPFNPSTVIKFSIPNDSRVTLKVFDILGREVTTLINQDMKTGAYEVTFNASSLTSGIYFYTIQTDHFTQTKKMVLLK